MDNQNFHQKPNTENKGTSFPKAVQYANEILEGKYTLDSLKGQVPDSWIGAVQGELESRGFLVLSDNIKENIQEKNISPEEITQQIDHAKEEFINETEREVEKAVNIGINVNEEVIDQVKQETNFDKNISEIKNEAEKSLSKFKNKEILNQNLEDLKEYFSENTKPTSEWKYNPDLDGDGEIALRLRTKALLQLGADKIQAHGIAKGPIGEQFKSLLNILTNGIDERHNGMLYTAPLTLDPDLAAGAGSVLGTGGGTAYIHGGFIVLAKKGIHTIQHIDDIGGVLVNQAVVDTLPQLVQKLKISFPNLSIDSYENSPKVIQEINSQSNGAFEKIKTSDIENNKITIEQVENDPEFQRMYEQMVLDQYKKDFPIDFESTYEPELDKDLNLVPKNKNDTPILASMSITQFKNTDVFELKQKVFEKYILSKEQYNLDDMVESFNDIYIRFSRHASTDHDKKEIEKMAEKILMNDPSFKSFYDESMNANKGQELQGQIDAIGRFIDRKGKKTLGVF